MSGAKVAPFGSWKSPITWDMIVYQTIGTINPVYGVGPIRLDGEDVYWSEIRPTEDGRYVVVRRTPDGQTTVVAPPAFNARTRVHENCGGDLAVQDRTLNSSSRARGDR